MATNQYFNQVNFQAEQDLVQDLIDESIQIYGHNVYYVPRTDGNIDAFLGEDPLASFANAVPVEMYVKSYQSFQGQSEFISKFGLMIEDQLILSVSQRRFTQTVSNTVPTIVRPRENDLIYIEMSPDNRYLFEIRFVENKEQLFQLGKLYTYELRCEVMNFNNEIVNTGNTDVDGVATREAYTIELALSAANTVAAGDYEVGETVYQGDSLEDAAATGIVYAWDDTAHTLQLQQITGVFAANANVIGVLSDAEWTTGNSTPNTAPTIHDPISDNELLQGDTSVVVSRGTNPLDE